MKPDWIVKEDKEQKLMDRQARNLKNYLTREGMKNYEKQINSREAETDIFYFGPTAHTDYGVSDELGF